MADPFHPVPVSTSEHWNILNHPAHFQPVCVCGDPDPHTLLVPRLPMGTTVGDSATNDYSLTMAPCIRPIGGHLKYFVETWVRFCHDKWVLDIVRDGYKLEFTHTPPTIVHKRVTPIPNDKDQRLALENKFRISSRNRPSVKSNRKTPSMGSCRRFS